MGYLLPSQTVEVEEIPQWHGDITEKKSQRAEASNVQSCEPSGPTKNFTESDKSSNKCVYLQLPLGLCLSQI